MLEAASQGVAHASGKYRRLSGAAFVDGAPVYFFSKLFRARLHAAAGDESAPHLLRLPIPRRGEAPPVAE